MMDRGMMRWMPFSAIKEQSEGLNELYEKQNQVQMPILDEQQLELINDIVCCATSENKQVNISYQKQNKAHAEVGYIHYYDKTRNELRIRNQYDNVLCININHITDIKYA
ncbi:YolD-like family protein [Bacillus pseudomycoides]|uniref:YolD-like family protein n=1 Tax=Bacillus pseudomycoides TaxID=64104 RepID=UPI0023DA37A3|nr:YolD-like family protein [Bacillus pseudomycoides]MDF2086610.1 YolD-like family protein [Bacillus pseudomycoides]